MDITISDKARTALDQLVTPLVVEIELYFSCMIRKRVIYPPSAHEDAIAVDSPHPNLRLFFRPVMSKTCSVHDPLNKPGEDLVPFPLEKVDQFMPKWFTLDNSSKGWVGEYGYKK
jgi:hypothetical protein